MKIVIEIDGVICTDTDGEYEDAEPIRKNILAVNRLHDAGNLITFFTSRGYESGKDWRDFTEDQLIKWKVQYDGLEFGKPEADYYIDDKSLKERDLDWLASPK